MLPNIEQFCRACPQARATMYCDPNCVVKHKVCEVLSSDVIATVPPPNVILQWDPHSDIFHRISLQVHKDVYLDKQNRFLVFVCELCTGTLTMKHCVHCYTSTGRVDTACT